MLIHCPDKYIKQERKWGKDEEEKQSILIGKRNNISIKRKLIKIKETETMLKEYRNETGQYRGRKKREYRDIYQISVFLPTSAAASPLSVKLFRAASAARLIKFSFLQITIRKRAVLLNHITTTRYTAVYLCWERASERVMSREKQRQHKRLHYTLIISLFLLWSLCMGNLFVNALNSALETHLSATLQNWKTGRDK